MPHTHSFQVFILASAFMFLAPLTAVMAQEPTLTPYAIEGVPGGSENLGDFVVGPGKVELTMNPGESKTVNVLVTNRTGERRIFNLTTEDATGSTDPTMAVQLLGTERGPYTLKDYIKVPATTFELDHSMRATIPVTITIPPDAEPGGRYGSLLVDTVAVDAVPADDQGTVPQSAIVARIGTLFFITIPGSKEYDASLKEFATAPKQSVFQNGPITFGLLHENHGTMHIVPYGELRIRNIFGEEVGYGKIDPWFVLPKSNRLREVTWDRDYLFGRYTATVSINRGYDDIVDEMSYSFWVLPWKPLTAGFAVLFVLVFLMRTFFRTFEFKRK